MDVKLTAVLSARVDAFVSGINQAASKLQTFGQKAEEIGSTLSKTVTLPLTLLGGASLKAAADMDSLKKGLGNIMGSSIGAEAELKKLKEVAKLPGLGFKEAVSGSINLQAAGFSADLARRALAGFGNALATVGKGKAELDGVNLALTQMATSPKVLQEEINQIRERLPQFSQLMIQAFGINRSEDIQKLSISGKAFVERMVVELEKLPKATGGLKNAFKNASDSIESAAAKVGTAINRNFNIEGLLNRFADALTRLTDKFERLSPQMQTFILSVGGLAAAAGPLALALGSIVKILPALGIGLRVLTGPIGILSTAVILLASNWDSVKLKSYEALESIGEGAGMALIDLGKMLNSTTLINEGMAQLAKSKQFRVDFINPIEASDKLAKTKEMLARVAERRALRGANTPTTSLIDPDAEEKLKAYVKAQSEASKSIIDSLQRTRDISISLIQDETERKKAELKAQAADRRAQVNAEVQDERVKSREILAINEKLFRDLKELEARPKAITTRSVNGSQTDTSIQSSRDALQMKLFGGVDPLNIKGLESAMDKLVEALKNKKEQVKQQASDMFSDLKRVYEGAFSGWNVTGMADQAEKYMELIQARMKNMTDKQKVEFLKWAQNMTTIFAGLGQALGDGFAAFGEALANGKNPFAAFGKSILKSFGEMLSMIGREMLKQAAALAALAIISGGALSPIAIRTGLAGAALVTAGSAINSVKLAKGGEAFKPTLATVGDNPNAGIDRELIGPTSTFRRMVREEMGGMGGAIEVFGSISNDVITLASRRGQTVRQSLRGK